MRNKTMKTIFEKMGKMGIAGMFIMITLVVTVFVSAQSIYDLYNALSWSSVLSPRTSVAADTSAAFDVSKYNGKIVFVQTITGAGGTSITYAAKFQHSADGTTWTSAPTDSAFTDFTSASRTVTGAVAYKVYDPRKVKRYLRYITTLSASDTIQCGVLAVGQLRTR